MEIAVKMSNFESKDEEFNNEPGKKKLIKIISFIKSN